MAATLTFGDATSNEGFTPLSTASFSDLRPARIVREMIQNSLDAALVDAGEDTAIMRFMVKGITGRQVPDLKGYEKAFIKATAYQTQISGGTLPDAASQVVTQIKNGLNDVKSGNAKLLSVVDNGIGLDTKRMNSLLGDGSSTKSGESSGSYGVGHLAPMSLSDIRYMLYGGVTQNGHRIVAGRTVLASHQGSRKLKAAQGYLIDAFRDGRGGNLYDFISTPYPSIVKNYIDQIAAEWGHGSVVMMLVFNNFRNAPSLWEVVSKVASYNFCAAIYQGKLVIEVMDGSETRKLDKNSLEDILEQDKERVRVARSDSFFEGLRPSGQNAYSILKTLADCPRQRVEVGDGVAYLSLMTPSPGGSARVDLFRNGMWITDDVFALRRADFANREPFHAVIEVEAKESGNLHRLIRKAEGPMHDTLSFTLLSKTEAERLRTCLQELADRIKEQVPEVGNEGYTVDDFLVVDADAGDGRGKRSFSFWGIPTIASRNRINQLILGIDPIEVEPDQPNPKPPRPPRPPQPPTPPDPREKRSSPLPFTSAVAPNGDGRLSASIVSQMDVPEAWLVLRVDENTDVTCDRIWQDEDVSVTSVSINVAEGHGGTLESEIPSGGKVVKLRGMSENTTYELDIEYTTPLGLASSVGSPVFRLELHRPPTRQKLQENERDANDA